MRSTRLAITDVAGQSKSGALWITCPIGFFYSTNMLDTCGDAPLANSRCINPGNLISWLFEFLHYIYIYKIGTYTRTHTPTYTNKQTNQKKEGKKEIAHKQQQQNGKVNSSNVDGSWPAVRCGQPLSFANVIFNYLLHSYFSVSLFLYIYIYIPLFLWIGLIKLKPTYRCQFGYTRLGPERIPRTLT